jgi:magnesium-transporting ATPase (P-type)
MRLGIVKRYPFASSMQRMSVIVHDPTTKAITLFCKGSPEKIIELSRPESGNGTLSIGNVDARIYHININIFYISHLKCPLVFRIFSQVIHKLVTES